MDDNENVPSYENLLSNWLSKQNSEKSFVDKVLNRQDSERLQKLMKKDKLNRSDLTEILYIISGTNVKLVNYNDWDRYLLGKAFAWIRDFATLCEDVIIWKDAIGKEKKEAQRNVLTGDISKKERLEYKENNLKDAHKISRRVNEIQEHNFKFLVDVYLNLSNSTLSLGASGFDTLTKSRFEYFYPLENQNTQPAQSGRLNLNLKK
jgi:hypothetical protein